MFFCVFLSTLLLSSIAFARTLYCLQDDIFGENKASVKAPVKAPAKAPATPVPARNAKDKPKADDEIPEANPFAPSVILVEEKDEKGMPKKSLPKVMKDGRVIYEDLESKDPATMTEDDFYKTMTVPERNILPAKPETGPALFKAGVLLSRLGRPHFAKLLLLKSLDANGEPADYAAVLDELGPERIYDLITKPLFMPEALKVIDKATAEAKKHWEQPDIINAAIKQAHRGPQKERVKAVEAVRHGGMVALKILFTQLTGPEEESKKAAGILRALGDLATFGLIASLQSKNEKLKEKAIEFLGETKHQDVPDALLGYYMMNPNAAASRDVLQKALTRQFGKVPTSDEIFNRFSGQASELYARTKALPHTHDGQSTLWKWDEGTDAPVMTTVTEQQLYRNKTVEAAERAFAAEKQGISASKSSSFLPLYMTAVAEKIVYDAGLDAPIDTTPFTNVFAAPTESQLLASLEFALQTKHYKGGIIPVVLLGKKGNKAICYGTGTPSPFIQATSAPDRRLRFAALTALLRLDPDKPFLGIGKVIDSLVQFTTSTGQKKLIVATPLLEDAMLLGNYFTKEGYFIVPAVSGSEVIRFAQNDADIEIVFAMENLLYPDIRTVIQVLGNDYRTADIAIAVDSRNTFDRMKTIGIKDPPSNAAELVAPYDQASGKWILERLVRQTELEPVPAKVRLAQSRVAASFYLSLYAKRPKMYAMDDMEPFVRRLIDTPFQMATGLKFALEIGTTSMQNHLANQTGDVRLSDENRQKCLDAFTAHLARYGSLLRGPDVVRIYDRYNASEKENKKSQDILAAMLDAYESAVKKNKK